MKQGIAPWCEVGSATSPEGGKNFEEHVKSREVSYLKGSRRRKTRICLAVGGGLGFFFLGSVKSSNLKENITYPCCLRGIFPII